MYTKIPYNFAMSKYPKRYWLTFLYTFPADILVFILVLVIWALWGTKLHWCNGLWCELKPDSWPTRSWYRYKYKGKYTLIPPQYRKEYGTWITWAGTTFGHGGFYGPTYSGSKGVDTDTEFHEHIHVEWFECATLYSFLVSVLLFVLLRNQLTTALISSISLWTIGSLLFTAGNWFQAWMRGEDPYRGSIHEEAAYALTELWNKKTTE